MLLQLNVEGISKAKIDVINQIAKEANPTAILLQETHSTDHDSLSIPGYTLAAHINSRVYGIATFVLNSVNWHAVDTSPLGDEVEWISTNVAGVTVTNVYKPPKTPMQADSLPRYVQPCIYMYAGDFNSHSTTWGYSSNNSDGDVLEHWASSLDLILLHDPKQPPSSSRNSSSSHPT